MKLIYREILAELLKHFENHSLPTARGFNLKLIKRLRTLGFVKLRRNSLCPDVPCVALTMLGLNKALRKS